MSDNDHNPEKSALADRRSQASWSDEDHSNDMNYIKHMGPTLVHSVFTASKTVQLYQLNNEVVRRTLSELIEVIRNIVRQEGRALLRVSAEFLYINDVRISMDSHSADPHYFLIDEMKKRELEAFEFHPDLDVGEAGKFLKLFYELDEGEDAFERLQERMRESSIQNVEVFPWIDREMRLADSSESQKDVRSESNRVFFRTVNLMKGILHALEEKYVVQVKKAKRLTQQMTDIIQTDESILLGLASIKDFDEYTYMHSVNVCILSMLIADRLRLYKQDVARLGLAALFHDVGKVHVPAALVNGSSVLSKNEWELMKYHTFLGAIELARVKAVSEIVDGMFVALQHHVHYNMNGYPQKPGGWKLRLFTRIVTVADYFDAMTSSRSYRKIPLTPDVALRFILEKSGEIFDPLVAKAFIQAMGIYPVGTIVEMNTGEKAVVVKQNTECRYIHRPTVQLMSSSSESGKQIVDLTERSSGEYLFRRSIVRSLHDEESGIDKHSCFMEEPDLLS